MQNISKQIKRVRRHLRIRAKVSGTSDCPRLSVFRSNRYLYAQLIDDTAGRTIASASSLALKAKGGSREQAVLVGKEIAKAAKAKGVTKVVFDRGGFLYAGVIKQVADSAREGGLEF